MPQAPSLRTDAADAADRFYFSLESVMSQNNCLSSSGRAIRFEPLLRKHRILSSASDRWAVYRRAGGFRVTGTMAYRRNYARYAAAVLLIMASLALCACSPRPNASVLKPVPSVGVAELVNVFVVSTRAARPDATVLLPDGSAATPAYLRYVISIPPTHKLAQIEWPSGAPDPARHFTVVSAEPVSEERFVAEIAAAAARGDALGRDVGIFVHGYNNSFQESLFRTAQLVADAKAGGSAVLFSWPSKAELTGYIADKDAVTFSRDALAHVIARVSAEGGVRGVKLIAHSMGSWLAVEVVRQLRIAADMRSLVKLNDVTLAAPDIDTDVFLQQLRVIGRLRSPITVLVSKDDQALSFSRLLAGGQLRAGAADINDPRVIAGAQDANVRVVDISGLATPAGAGHDGFTAFAAIYGRLLTGRDGLVAGDFGPGVYTIDVADRLRPLQARLQRTAVAPILDRRD